MALRGLHVCNLGGGATLRLVGSSNGLVADTFVLTKVTSVDSVRGMVETPANTLIVRWPLVPSV